MRILLTGASGLIGRALQVLLRDQGHEVVCLTRSQRPTTSGLIWWNPYAGQLPPESVDSFDAVVHLAGESIMGRWTAAKKARILESRVKGTRLLCETLAGSGKRPKVLISASAIGYYGDRADRVLDERSPAGSLFLSEVAQAWERATEAAQRSGIRVVNLRIGFVLNRAGGGLAAMLLPFRLGLGGRVGTGRQYMSWIAIDDLVGAISHALCTVSLRGPVNAVAPHPVTNREFTRTLGQLLHRPTIFPLPAFAVRLALGQMGQELLLASTRVEPAALVASGYKFRFPEVESALRYTLNVTG